MSVMLIKPIDMKVDGMALKVQTTEIEWTINRRDNRVEISLRGTAPLSEELDKWLAGRNRGKGRRRIEL